MLSRALILIFLVTVLLHAILCMQLQSTSETADRASGTSKPNCVHTCIGIKVVTQVFVVLWKHTSIWCAAFTQYQVSEASSCMVNPYSLDQLPVIHTMIPRLLAVIMPALLQQ